MRMALVAQEYPPETAKGGIGTQAHLKAHGLAARGHEVVVLSRAPAAGAASERREGAVRVVRIPGWETRLPIYAEAVDWLTYSAEVAAALARLHAETPLDLIEFPEWGAEGYVHLLNRTEWNRIPVVLQLHGPLSMFAHTMGWPDPASEFHRVCSAMERLCVAKADAVYSSSRCSAEWCGRHYGLDVARTPILHTGVDTRHFAPRPGARAARPTIVFVGKLVPNKGAATLVEAACRVARERPDLRLQLIGRAEDGVVRELRALAEAASCPDLLDVVGFVPREDLPERLAAAHVFAAPSVYEGGPGFVYLEAMACGLPVIACSGSGAGEVVQPGENGFLVPPGDVEALRAALCRLLTDESERAAMGGRARRYAVEQADSRACIERIEAFFLRTIAGARGGTNPEGAPATASP